MQLMNVKQVANLFNVTEVTIYSWVKSGILPSLVIGSTIRFEYEEIISIARKGRTLQC